MSNRTIWVCTDCLFAREGDGTENPDREPWGLLPTADVSLGVLWPEHCERRDFDTAPCDGCGTPLAGERYAYTVWGA